jgi:La-related protein 7
LKEIRRKKEVVTREKHEEDACTIYVENLPPSATIESVTNLFDKFGKVLYVSLPKYKITQVRLSGKDYSLSFAK